VKVIISGGFSGPYEQLLPEFERTTAIQGHHRLRCVAGNGAADHCSAACPRRACRRGDPLEEGLADLIAAQRIAAGTDVDLARTPLGVAVRAGAPKPDVSTVEAFKQAYSRPTPLRSRAARAASSSERRLSAARHRGQGQGETYGARTGATAMVASGEADIAVMPVSEIVHAPGVELAGTIAQEIQLNQVFAAAVVPDRRRSKRQATDRIPRSDRASAAISPAGWSRSETPLMLFRERRRKSFQ